MAAYRRLMNIYFIYLSCHEDDWQMHHNFNACLGRIHSRRLAYQYLIQANKVTVSGVPCKEGNKIHNVKKFDGCGIVVLFLCPNMLQEGCRMKSKWNAHYLVGACDRWPRGFYVISTCGWTKCRSMRKSLYWKLWHKTTATAKNYGKNYSGI
jgi:hypothetical protein